MVLPPLFPLYAESIDALLPSLTGPTVLVLDNASVHRANLVKAKRGEWRRKGRRLLFLPPYCPHLNVIESLWRMMKYHWLAPGDYRDFTTLCQQGLYHTLSERQRHPKPVRHKIQDFICVTT